MAPAMETPAAAQAALNADAVSGLMEIFACGQCPEFRSCFAWVDVRPIIAARLSFLIENEAGFQDNIIAHDFRYAQKARNARAIKETENFKRRLVPKGTPGGRIDVRKHEVDVSLGKVVEGVCLQPW